MNFLYAKANLLLAVAESYDTVSKKAQCYLFLKLNLFFSGELLFDILCLHFRPNVSFLFFSFLFKYMLTLVQASMIACEDTLACIVHL